MNKLKIFTWHVHGSYLYYLCHADCIFYIPVKSDGSGGKGNSSRWPDNLIEIPEDEVKNAEFDLILFQSKTNYLEDQFRIFSEKQRALPKVYLEHDPPREIPTDTKHVVDDPNILTVHVTRFNELMWDNNQTPTTIIDHGVTIPQGVEYKGDLEKGIVVINNIHLRGRRLGYDVFKKIRKEVPIDIVGMGHEEVGGLGEFDITELPELISHYRFFLNPIRYTSLGLSVCEAMTIGMPIIGLATTEMVTAIRNDFNGYLDTDVDWLILKMKELINNKDLAKQLGDNGKTYAENRFNIKRFAEDWEKLFKYVIEGNLNINNKTEEIELKGIKLPTRHII